MHVLRISDLLHDSRNPRMPSKLGFWFKPETCAGKDSGKEISAFQVKTATKF